MKETFLDGCKTMSYGERGLYHYPGAGECAECLNSGTRSWIGTQN